MTILNFLRPQTTRFSPQVQTLKRNRPREGDETAEKLQEKRDENRVASTMGKFCINPFTRSSDQ